MARIRSIKPEFWTDSFMVRLPHLARLLYIALWTAADDHGYIKDEPERLAMELMPREEPELVDDYIQLFQAAGRLEMFADEQGTYLRVAKWEAHQKVDKPSKSRISREGSRKVAIPNEVRRDLANKYGCEPGMAVEASCYYCGAGGGVHWHNLSNGRPSSWVTFPGLEIDHLHAEFEGGETASRNMVLACRACNRSKGSKEWIAALCLRDPANPRESSRMFTVGKEGEQGREGKGEERGGADAPTEMAFVGKIIRLKADAFDRWRKAYHAIPDLVAELTKADDFYSENRPEDGKWFFPVSRWLDRAHKDALKGNKADPDEAIYRGAQVMA